jgi:hypothetical protein
MSENMWGSWFISLITHKICAVNKRERERKKKEQNILLLTVTTVIEKETKKKKNNFNEVYELGGRTVKKKKRAGRHWWMSIHSYKNITFVPLNLLEFFCFDFIEEKLNLLLRCSIKFYSRYVRCVSSFVIFHHSFVRDDEFHFYSRSVYFLVSHWFYLLLITINNRRFILSKFLKYTNSNHRIILRHYLKSHSKKKEICWLFLYAWIILFYGYIFPLSNVNIYFCLEKAHGQWMKKVVH